MQARTQLVLDSEAHRRAKARAAELGISLAEYLRRLVARDLGEPVAGADPSEVFDLGDSGGSDVARHKDAYLAEAVGRRKAVRKRRARPSR
jgi:hypothetical protein